jgi:hypothetical protein
MVTMYTIWIATCAFSSGSACVKFVLFISI